MKDENKNMELWNKVCKTNPDNTKGANVRGNNITAIAPQTQIKSATEQFGAYGEGWGFKKIEINTEVAELTGLVFMKGLFFHPKGEFEIISSISLYRDNAKTKPDNDFAKKLETDCLTKGLSKLGFNSDVFEGSFDDNKYVQMMKKEFGLEVIEPIKNIEIPPLLLTNIQFNATMKAKKAGVERILLQFNTKEKTMSDEHRKKLNAYLKTL